MKRTTVIGAIIAALCVALWCTLQYSISVRGECLRLRADRTALLSDISTYRVRDSLNAATAHVLTMRHAELDAHFACATALVHDMGIKLRRLESLAQNAVETRYQFMAPVRDTMILGRQSSLVHYDNGHMTLDGVVADGRFRGEIISCDTLTQVVHRIPHRFLFVRWGTKQLRQEILSSNPHTRIVYSKYIKIQ